MNKIAANLVTLYVHSVCLCPFCMLKRIQISDRDTLFLSVTQRKNCVKGLSSCRRQRKVLYSPSYSKCIMAKVLQLGITAETVDMKFQELFRGRYFWSAVSCGKFVKFAYKRQWASENQWAKGNEGTAGSDQTLLKRFHCYTALQGASCKAGWKWQHSFVRYWLATFF